MSYDRGTVQVRPRYDGRWEARVRYVDSDPDGGLPLTSCTVRARSRERAVSKARRLIVPPGVRGTGIPDPPWEDVAWEDIPS